MLDIVLTATITFFITNLFGYVVHRSLHQKWAGSLNKAHMTHHQILYPPSDFCSEHYRYAGKDSTTRYFVIPALPIIFMPALMGLFHALPWKLVITALLVEGIMGYLHNYLHDATHITNHWLNQVPILNRFYQRLVYLHYLHHLVMHSNYGIFSFSWDRLFGTFKE